MTFDDKLYDSLMASRDYLGAAHLLDNATPKNYNSSLLLHQQANDLRRRGDIQNSILQELSADDQDAFHFASALEGNGNIPHTRYNANGVEQPNTKNKYGDEYDTLINGLSVNTNDGNKFINTITVSFKNPEYYSSFLKNLNVESSELTRKYGVKVGKNAKNGYTILHVDRNNPAFLSILDAVKPRDRGWFDNISNAVGTYVRGLADDSPAWMNIRGADATSYIYDSIADATGVDSVHRLAPGDIAGKILSLPTVFTHAYINGKQLEQEEDLKNFEIHGIDSDGKVWKQQAFNWDNIEKAQQLAWDAKQIKKDAEEKHASTEKTEQITLMPYMTPGHANLLSDFERGIISPSEFDAHHKNIKEGIERSLATFDVNNYQLYARVLDNDDNENIVMQELTKTKDKEEIMLQIKRALDKGKLTYTEGEMNGTLGIYLSIPPEADTKYDLVNKIFGEAKNIFIPGFYGRKAQANYEKDTRIKAIRDAADMRRWNYSKMLNTGEIIGHDKALGYYINKKGENGGDVRVPIDKASYLNMLNEDYSILDAANSIINNFDDKGNYKPRKINGVLTQTTPEEDANLLANGITNEIYPQDSFSNVERLSAQSKLVKYIMDLMSNAILNL